ncbi:UNVERIFIED_ORG: hypothetical protein ABID33_000183 [Xanthobacter viscosus]|uniref:CHAT domain-containing protein n=1 Tax=Xanthobacter autotrophicus TaxID=280 RepID=A0A6C1KI07_XANAU|nr:CHAT domain-containing protein [Xanthobacter autotrophicus]TLX43919.1 CHAT domain-containing protein [Xanthobacter autotrophicus]
MPSRAPGDDESQPSGALRLVRPEIRYFVIVPEDDPGAASALQGFSHGITRVDNLVRSLVHLPADVVEFALPEPVLSGRRVNGVASWHWMPVALYALTELVVSAEMPFWVMLTHDPAVASAVDAWIATQHYKPLHISEAAGPGRANAHTVDPDQLRDHFRALLAQVAADEPELERRLVSEGLEHWKGRPARDFPVPVPGHNVTMSNVMALQGIGFRFVDAGPEIPADPEDYQRWIAETANAVLDERQRSYRSPALRTTPAQPDLYVTAPALFAHVYEGGFDFPKDANGRAVRDMLQMMQRQTGYRLTGAGRAWASSLKSPLAQALLAMRRSETQIQVAAAGLAAAGTLSATVRLPPGVNRAQGTVRQMANHARSEKIKPAAKLVKTFADVQHRLNEAVGSTLGAVIARSETGVKLVTDVPLEWLPVGNLPLMLRHNVSRITATPGNLLIGTLARSQLLHLSVEAFREVLVISAIDREDPIANVLLDALESWRDGYEGRITLRIVRVQTRAAFVAAMNAYRGAVMIFDGHGHHDQASGTATLKIGKEDVSIWDLRDEIHVPPIVILSACDTQAADRSHATTANGFLSAGATTVVASLLPLRAADAAVFIARLVWRIAEYLPAVTGPNGRAVLWSEVMGGMFRLLLVYDLIFPLLTAGKLTFAQYSELNMAAIIATTNQDPNWWDATLTSLGEHLSEDSGTIAKRAARTVASSDAIRYTQVGNPELIVIKSIALLEEVGYDPREFGRFVTKPSVEKQ